MAVRKISVPKVPKSAYNPDRPISGLLKAQIAMLEEANLSHDPTMAVRSRGPQTEGQAARYIQQLHSTLREHLDKKEVEQKELPSTERRAIGPRTASTADGGKKFAATAGPSAAARQRALADVKTPASRARKPARKRRSR